MITFGPTCTAPRSIVPVSLWLSAGHLDDEAFHVGEANASSFAGMSCSSSNPSAKAAPQ